MRNITVSVDDETYRRARIRAAELDTSVSAVVREMLKKFAQGRRERREDFERRKALQEEMYARIRDRGFSARDRLSRDELHDRDALR